LIYDAIAGLLYSRYFDSKYLGSKYFVSDFSQNCYI
jgi:hypothetical protein